MATMRRKIGMLACAPAAASNLCIRSRGGAAGSCILRRPGAGGAVELCSILYVPATECLRCFAVNPTYAKTVHRNGTYCFATTSSRASLGSASARREERSKSNFCKVKAGLQSSLRKSNEQPRKTMVNACLHSRLR